VKKTMCDHEVTTAENPKIQSFTWTEVHIHFDERCDKCGKTIDQHSAIFKREEK